MEVVPPLRPLPRSFYLRPAAEVARDLLGCWLVRDLPGERLIVRLLETEAYLGARDRASHAWAGRRTARNAALYLAGGHAYVYFIYGMHFCLNVVTGEFGEGEAVLLRAAEPVRGAARMATYRGLDGSPRKSRELLSGPGRLCQALRIDRDLDGIRLARGSLWLARGELIGEEEVACGPRVGIAYAGEAVRWPLRFAISGHSGVSRPRLP